MNEAIADVTSPVDEIEATVLQAVEHQKMGQIAEARILYQTVLKILPQHAQANHNLGVLLMQGGSDEHAPGVAHLEAAIVASPTTAQYWLSYIDGLMQSGEHATARQVIELARAHGLRSEALKALAARLPAEDAAPATPSQEVPRTQSSVKSPKKRAGNRGQPSDKDIQKLVDLFNQKRITEVEVAAREMTQRYPHHGFGWKSLGASLQVLGHAQQAIDCLKKAASLLPEDGEIQSNLGAAYYSVGQIESAIVCLRRTLESNPNHAPAHNNLGNALHLQGDLAAAAAAYRRAIELQPDHADAWNNLGLVLKTLGKLDKAIHCHQQTLKLAPNSHKSWLNLGHAIHEKDIEKALECYQKAIEIKPDYAEAYNQAGRALSSLGRMNEAETSFRRAVLFNPADGKTHSNLLFCLSHKEDIDSAELFADHLRFSEVFEAPLRPHWRPHANTRDPARTLRIGFVSADFCNHAVAFFVDQIFAHLARRPDLALVAYYNNTIQDKVTERLRGYFNDWQAVSTLTDEALAEKIRADGIDILFDLSGHTGKHRLLTFAHKPAPIQISWIGYPGTTGLTAMDYLIRSKWFERSGKMDDQHTEKLVLLPATMPFEHILGAPDIAEPPALRNGYVTFGSFNRNSKISDTSLSLWAQVLHAVPNAKMLIGDMSPVNRDTLAGKFAIAGIDISRLIFHPRTQMIEYLRLHNEVDILLDTVPYTGGTTSLHALWMGVPVLARVGNTSPQRTADELLGELGLGDWVTHTNREYVERAVTAARDIEKLKKLRAGMRVIFINKPYGTPETYAAMFSCMLRTLWKRWCAGEPAAKTYID